MPTVSFANLWIDGRWRSNVGVQIDDAGNVVGTGPAAAGAAPIPGLTLPGLADAHCHAFQRLLPAWTQRARASSEDFWSWREAMYTAAAQIGPQDLEAIAARCYLELLRGGYTGVVEFLYLHRLAHQAGAALDADVAIVRGAQRAGIGLTLLPTLYQHSNFGGVAPTAGQARFIRSTEEFLHDWGELRQRYPAGASVTLGVAFHSLRAVQLESIIAVSSELAGDERCRVIHIHVAEQPAEVAACRNHYGQSPVALLAERGLLNDRWALVHAIHTTARELEQIAASGATLVLCPTTEADLGDGCADAAHFLNAGGRLAIGSDSNIGRSACVELRQLEWALRLLRGRRNVLSTTTEPAVADRLYRSVLDGGWRAAGQGSPARASAPGRADFVTFDNDEGDWPQLPPAYYLSALVFGAQAPLARQVMVAGRWVIRDGRHAQQAQIDADYRAALERVGQPLRAALNETTTG
ncbi:MAG TPA: formimidoylglutamate deiminase [Steroidobacteraceae bacterium]|jgi:formimidoylglutamate deiminase